MSKETLFVIICSIVALIIILVTEPIYNLDLFNWSLIEIPVLQVNTTNSGFVIWDIYSNVCLVIACGAPIVWALAHTLTQRHRAVYYVIVLSAIFLVMNITKLIYHQARPFWDSSSIKAGSCSSQFGNPSGHSLTSLGMALAVWLDYNQSVVDGKVTQDSPWSKMWIRTLLCALAVAFGVSIGWSRFVLGAHSMNQIVFGLLLGVWIAFSFHFGTYHAFME